MKRFVGYIANKIVKSMPRSKKVSPTIKSVKPTKDVSGSVERVKRRELSKRIDKVEGSKGKIDTGRKMMREGQKELKRMTETGTAFKFKHGTTRQKTFAITPGENPKQKYKGLIEESKPQKKFKKGKEKKMGFNEYKKSLREKKMGGGRVMKKEGGMGRPVSKRPLPIRGGRREKVSREMNEKLNEQRRRELSLINAKPLKSGPRSKPRPKMMGGGMMGRRFGMKKGSKFPDLTGDGKVTFADILKGRGVINGKKKKSNGRTFLSKKK